MDGWKQITDRMGWMDADHNIEEGRMRSRSCIEAAEAGSEKSYRRGRIPYYSYSRSVSGYWRHLLIFLFSWYYWMDPDITVCPASLIVGTNVTDPDIIVSPYCGYWRHGSEYYCQPYRRYYAYWGIYPLMYFITCIVYVQHISCIVVHYTHYAPISYTWSTEVL